MRSTRRTGDLTGVLALVMGTGLLFAVCGFAFIVVAVVFDGYVPSYAGRWAVGSAVLLFTPIVLKRYLDRGI